MLHLPKHPGFTLLELMITSLLGALLLLGATAMFGLFMRNTSATNIRKQINQEGQQILSVIEFNLRNARSVETCGGGTYVRYVSKDGLTQVIQRRGPENGITTNYMGISPTNTGNYFPLHSQFAIAGSAPFTCTSPNPSTVVINFTLTYDKITPNISQNFRSTVQVRNATIR